MNTKIATDPLVTIIPAADSGDLIGQATRDGFAAGLLPRFDLATPNRTMRRLYDAEFARTESVARATSRASTLYGALLVIASADKGRPGSLPAATYSRHKRALRRAGLCPLASPSDLAVLAGDLGTTSSDALGRLLWTLQTSRERDLGAVLARWGEWIMEARAQLRLLDLVRDERPRNEVLRAFRGEARAFDEYLDTLCQRGEIVVESGRDASGRPVRWLRPGPASTHFGEWRLRRQGTDPDSLDAERQSVIIS
jgi:hypothetical protein